ncbi:MAG: hypothetical protein ACRDPK_16675 [Carbonactinosporaceae bacterium]
MSRCATRGATEAGAGVSGRTGAGRGPGRSWTSAAGGWLAIGTSPGALALGAGLGARHGGPVTLVAILGGGALMAVLLLAQGRIGLVPPYGDDSTLAAVTPRYLPAFAGRVLSLVLALAMVGWFGFNIGLGGAALAALLAIPGPVGAVLMGAPIVVVALAGGRWNMLAILTTTSALVLVALVAVELPPPAWPLVSGLDGGSLAVADIAGFLGYVSVFAVRAPDFSAGLARPRDLAFSVALLVVPTLVMATAGGGIAWATGSSDVVGALSGPRGLAVANVFVAAAVIAPAFTTTYSGPLALRQVLPLGHRVAVLAIGGPGLVLAALRFDRALLIWLGLLAAALPPLIVPMATEAARRCQGAAHRIVPTWTWAPAALAALGCTAFGPQLGGQLGTSYAPLAGLGIAVAATAAWTLRNR